MQRESRGNECVVNVTVSLPPYSFFHQMCIWNNREILVSLFVGYLTVLSRLQRLFMVSSVDRIFTQIKLWDYMVKTYG